MSAPWSLGEPLNRDQLYAAAAEWFSHVNASGVVELAELHVEHVIGELMEDIEDAAGIPRNERTGRMAAIQHLQARLDKMRAARGYDEDASLRRFGEQFEGGAS